MPPAIATVIKQPPVGAKYVPFRRVAKFVPNESTVGTPSTLEVDDVAVGGARIADVERETEGVEDGEVDGGNDGDGDGDSNGDGKADGGSDSDRDGDGGDADAEPEMKRLMLTQQPARSPQ